MLLLAAAALAVFAALPFVQPHAPPPFSEASIYRFFVLSLGALAFILKALSWLSSSSASRSSSPQSSRKSGEFRRFQVLYTLVYLVVMCADWLQGPYTYALYQSYGFSQAQIGYLFIAGFGSSLVFGTFVGSGADRHGRKRLCLIFCVLYSLACVAVHFRNLYVLFLGRLVSGISTSILFSAFESWMVAEHHARGFDSAWLSSTFAVSTLGNSVVAILAGVLASYVSSTFSAAEAVEGVLAVFKCSMACLAVALVIISSTWSENYGDANSDDVITSMKKALSAITSNRSIFLLGVIQSCFEGGMYIFVFMWTPALTSTMAAAGLADEPFLHGWVFAGFMVCVLLGSTIFGLVSPSMRLEVLGVFVYLAAAVCLGVPTVTDHHIARLFAFFGFEMCCGLFWPCQGVLRSNYVPDDIRSSVMNLFRIPLNAIVVLVLANIDKLSEIQVFSAAASCMGVACVCQAILAFTTTPAASKSKHE